MALQQIRRWSVDLFYPDLSADNITVAAGVLPFPADVFGLCRGGVAEAWRSERRVAQCLADITMQPVLQRR